MTLTRKERESLVIDLLNKCTPIREIATQAGLSFRDIGAIKKKAEEEKEAKQGEAQQTLHRHKPTISFYKVRLRCKWLLN